MSNLSIIKADSKGSVYFLTITYAGNLPVFMILGIPNKEDFNYE